MSFRSANLENFLYLVETFENVTDKKRVPPWERAYLNFKLAERKRARELEEKNRPAKARQLDLEENRKRLAEIKKRLEAEESKD